MDSSAAVASVTALGSPFVSSLSSPYTARDSASAAILCMYRGARKIGLDSEYVIVTEFC